MANFTGYLGNVKDNTLTNIQKTQVEAFETETENQFRFVATTYDGQKYFYFFNAKGDKSLYEKVNVQEDGIIVNKIENTELMQAFQNAINLNFNEITIMYTPPQVVESPQLNETQKQVVDAIQEKIVIQPIIQPIQTQSGEAPVVWQTYTAEPKFKEVITKAETWAWNTVALPLVEKGVKVYNDNISPTEVRPREYVVFTVDDTVQDINFSGNTNKREESFINFIVQGQGTTFNNFVVEISKFIHDILRKERTKGVVRSITDRSIGFDQENNILTRTISLWYQYN